MESFGFEENSARQERLQGRRLASRCGVLSRIAQHGEGNRDAADRDQIDDLLVAEKFARFFECGVAYHVIPRKVHAEIVHGDFVRLHDPGRFPSFKSSATACGSPAFSASG